MKKEDYWLQSLERKLYTKLAWCLGAFSVTRNATAPLPWVIHYSEGRPVFIDDEGAVVGITDSKPNTPVFSINDTVTVTAKTLPNVTGSIKTTYGISLLNAIWIAHYAGDVIPFVNGYMDTRKIMGDITNAVLEEKLTVRQAKQCVKAMYWSTGLTQIAVPSASEKSLIPSKDVLKLKKQLLDKYKDRLDDPNVMADIEQQVVQADIDYIKGDPSEIFYKSKGSYANKRKQMMTMNGAEKSMEGGTKQVLNPTSLQDGINLEFFPMQVNSARMGAFNRGSETALGGEIVKFLMRVFQKTAITEDDCGTKLTWALAVNRLSSHILDNRYMMVGGKAVLIKPGVGKALEGKTIQLRSPMYCNTKKNNFCAVCMGKDIARSRNALPMLAVETGSRIMYIFMKATHVSGISTAEYDFKTHIH